MFQRYLSIGSIPELRVEPIQSDRVGNEVEVIIPIHINWEIEEIIANMRYARSQGDSIKKLWVKFAKIIYPCIVTEKDRSWFRRNVPK